VRPEVEWGARDLKAASFAAMRSGVSVPRINLSLTAAIAVAWACFLAGAHAQTVISASPGMVHYSEGRVLIENRPFDYDPKHFIHLKEGQRLRTGEAADRRARARGADARSRCAGAPR
jgi:hypothetical protein